MTNTESTDQCLVAGGISDDTKSETKDPCREEEKLPVLSGGDHCGQENVSGNFQGEGSAVYDNVIMSVSGPKCPSDILYADYNTEEYNSLEKSGKITQITMQDDNEEKSENVVTNSINEVKGVTADSSHSPLNGSFGADSPDFNFHRSRFGKANLFAGIDVTSVGSVGEISNIDDDCGSSMYSSSTCRQKKEKSHFFSFLWWFRKRRQEEKKQAVSDKLIANQRSPSIGRRSNGSVLSLASIASSFAFVPVTTAYKCGRYVDPKTKNIIEPDTDSYKKRLKMRDKSRELDKHVTLKSKYRLFGTDSLPHDKKKSDNMERLKMQSLERRFEYRRSVPVEKKGSFKRLDGTGSLKSTFGRKKRRAPPPPNAPRAQRNTNHFGDRSLPHNWTSKSKENFINGNDSKNSSPSQLSLGTKLGHRRTVSDSVKDKRPFLHVKGKRRAPAPPAGNGRPAVTDNQGSDTSKSGTPCLGTREIGKSPNSTWGKKRPAPPPPDKHQKGDNSTENEKNMEKGRQKENSKKKDMQKDVESSTDNDSPVVKSKLSPFSRKRLDNSNDIPPTKSCMKGSDSVPSLQNSSLSHEITENVEDVTVTQNKDKCEAFNDSLKLERGILKQAKELPRIEARENTQSENKVTLSPRPWYKRNRGKDAPAKKENYKSLERRMEKEDQLWMPEVQYARSSISIKNDNGFSIFPKVESTKEETKSKKREEEKRGKKKEDKEKRYSQVSLLANISDLDREAMEFIKREQEKEQAARDAYDARFYNYSTDSLPEVGWLVNSSGQEKESLEVNEPKITQAEAKKISSKAVNDAENKEQEPSSAKALIKLFNSYDTTRLTVNSHIHPEHKVEKDGEKNASEVGNKKDIHAELGARPKENGGPSVHLQHPVNDGQNIKETNSFDDFHIPNVVTDLTSFLDYMEQALNSPSSQRKSCLQDSDKIQNQCEFGSNCIENGINRQTENLEPLAMSKAECIFRANRQRRHHSPSPTIPTIVEHSESASTSVSSTPASTLGDSSRQKMEPFTPVARLETLSEASNMAKSERALKKEEKEIKVEAKDISEDIAGWTCRRCTLINKFSNMNCDACLAWQPSDHKPESPIIPLSAVICADGSDKNKKTIQTSESKNFINWEEELWKYFQTNERNTERTSVLQTKKDHDVKGRKSVSDIKSVEKEEILKSKRRSLCLEPNKNENAKASNEGQVVKKSVSKRELEYGKINQKEKGEVKEKVQLLELKCGLNEKEKLSSPVQNSKEKSAVALSPKMKCAYAHKPSSKKTSCGAQTDIKGAHLLNQKNGEIGRHLRSQEDASESAVENKNQAAAILDSFSAKAEQQHINGVEAEQIIPAIPALPKAYIREKRQEEIKLAEIKKAASVTSTVTNEKTKQVVLKEIKAEKATLPCPAMPSTFIGGWLKQDEVKHAELRKTYCAMPNACLDKRNKEDQKVKKVSSTVDNKTAQRLDEGQRLGQDTTEKEPDVQEIRKARLAFFISQASNEEKEKFEAEQKVKSNTASQPVKDTAKLVDSKTQLCNNTKVASKLESNSSLSEDVPKLDDTDLGNKVAEKSLKQEGCSQGAKKHTSDLFQPRNSPRGYIPKKKTEMDLKGSVIPSEPVTVKNINTEDEKASESAPVFSKTSNSPLTDVKIVGKIHVQRIEEKAPKAVNKNVGKESDRVDVNKNVDKRDSKIDINKCMIKDSDKTDLKIYFKKNIVLKSVYKQDPGIDVNKMDCKSEMNKTAMKDIDKMDFNIKGNNSVLKDIDKVDSKIEKNKDIVKDIDKVGSKIEKNKFVVKDIDERNLRIDMKKNVVMSLEKKRVKSGVHVTEKKEAHSAVEKESSALVDNKERKLKTENIYAEIIYPENSNFIKTSEMRNISVNVQENGSPAAVRPNYKANAIAGLKVYPITQRTNTGNGSGDKIQESKKIEKKSGGTMEVMFEESASVTGSCREAVMCIGAGRVSGSPNKVSVDNVHDNKGLRLQNSKEKCNLGGLKIEAVKKQGENVSENKVLGMKKLQDNSNLGAIPKIQSNTNQVKNSVITLNTVSVSGKNTDISNEENCRVSVTGKFVRKNVEKSTRGTQTNGEMKKIEVIYENVPTVVVSEVKNSDTELVEVNKPPKATPRVISLGKQKSHTVSSSAQTSTTLEELEGKAVKKDGDVIEMAVSNGSVYNATEKTKVVSSFDKDQKSKSLEDSRHKEHSIKDGILYTSLRKGSCIGLGTFALIGAKDFANIGAAKTGAHPKTFSPVYANIKYDINGTENITAVAKEGRWSNNSVKNKGKSDIKSAIKSVNSKVKSETRNVKLEVKHLSSTSSQPDQQFDAPKKEVGTTLSSTTHPEAEGNSDSRVDAVNTHIYPGDQNLPSSVVAANAQSKKIIQNDTKQEQAPVFQNHYPTSSPSDSELFTYSPAPDKKTQSPLKGLCGTSKQLILEQPSAQEAKAIEQLAAQLSGAQGLADFKADFRTTAHHSDFNTLAINKLLRKLEAAIAGGQYQQAAILAKELALLKINCSVTRHREEKRIQESLRPETIMVNMYVEDKVSHQGPIAIHVLPSITVGQLKQKIETDFEIPVMVQRWILGKELAVDDEKTLINHDVITNGCPIFLYLVAPDDDQESDNESNTEENWKEPSAKPPSPPPRGQYYNYELDRYSICESESEISTASSRDASEERNVVSGKIAVLNKIDETVPVPEREDRQSPAVVNVEGNDLPAGSQVQKGDIPEVIQDEAGAMAEQPHPQPPKEERFDTLKLGWVCPVCTLVNIPTRPGCSACTTDRPADYIIPEEYEVNEEEGERLRQEEDHRRLLQEEEQGRERQEEVEEERVIEEEVEGAIGGGERWEHYQQLLNLDHADIIPNAEPFECLVCFLPCNAAAGVTLRDCLHTFCRECLQNAVMYCDQAEVKCPYRDDDYSCNSYMQEREIKALVTPEVYERHLAKGVAEAENQIQNSFHCKTPDCPGWCVYEDNVNYFSCPVCAKSNCLTCQAIHEGMDCKQYQDMIQLEAETNEEVQRTKKWINDLMEKGEAMLCPNCKVILMKKWGCDWLRCSMCRTEICWVTRGPRWGIGGKGDVSGGCKCGVGGVKCHPLCNYCH